MQIFYYFADLHLLFGFALCMKAALSGVFLLSNGV